MELTKLKLAIRLQELDPALAVRAEAGEFSDYESEHATPKVNLYMLLSEVVKHTTNLKRRQLALEIMREVTNGVWDETKEEANAWFKREGKYLLRNQS